MSFNLSRALIFFSFGSMTEDVNSRSPQLGRGDWSLWSVLSNPLASACKLRIHLLSEGICKAIYNFSEMHHFRYQLESIIISFFCTDLLLFHPGLQLQEATACS
jgi:hypothetical protein